MIKKNGAPLFCLDKPAPEFFRALVPFDLSRFSRACRVLLWHFAAYKLLCGNMKKRSKKKMKNTTLYLFSSLFLHLLCSTFILDIILSLSFTRFYHLISSFPISLPVSLSGSFSLLPIIPQSCSPSYSRSPVPPSRI